MSIGIVLLFVLAVVLICIGFIFIYAWHKSPSNYEGAASAEIAKYLRKNDRNALLGVLFVYWTVALAILLYCFNSIRSG